MWALSFLDPCRSLDQFVPMVIQIGVAPFAARPAKDIPDLKPESKVRCMMPGRLLVLDQHSDVGEDLWWNLA